MRGSSTKGLVSFYPSKWYDVAQSHDSVARFPRNLRPFLVHKFHVNRATSHEMKGKGSLEMEVDVLWWMRTRSRRGSAMLADWTMAR